MKNILAISGSLRSKSANLTIIESIAKLFGDKITVETYDKLASLPHFNPDSDSDVPPPEIADLRRRIRQSDGVLISAPEYVFSIPGALKNALEWTVSTGDFSGKPTALITASTRGEKTHESLFLVLKTIEAKITENTALLISGAQTKVKNEKVVDAETVEQLNSLIESFLQLINE